MSTDCMLRLASCNGQRGQYSEITHTNLPSEPFPLDFAKPFLIDNLARTQEKAI